MKIRHYGLAVVTLVLFGAYGCSDSAAKATAAEEKAFAGGPPPANYMEGANKATAAAQKQPPGSTGTVAGTSN